MDFTLYRIDSFLPLVSVSFFVLVELYFLFFFFRCLDSTRFTPLFVEMREFCLFSVTWVFVLGFMGGELFLACLLLISIRCIVVFGL